MDEAGRINDWEASSQEDNYTLSDGKARWSLNVESTDPLMLRLCCEETGGCWQLGEYAEGWRLTGT